MTSPGTRPRVALALLRTSFGLAGLVRPELLVRRVDGAGPPSPAAVYAFRMFGIRTVVIGSQLLARDAEVRHAAVATAPVIHAADTVTATLLTVRGAVPRGVGAPLVAVSAANTVLAVLAARPVRSGRSGPGS